MLPVDTRGFYHRKWLMVTGTVERTGKAITTKLFAYRGLTMTAGNSVTKAVCQ